jgi:hypothetical protein
MLPSTNIAGLSRCAPVAWFVAMTSQMSRPSWLLPMLRVSKSVGLSRASCCRVRVSSS